MLIDELSGHTRTDYHEAIKAAPPRLNAVLSSAHDAVQELIKQSEATRGYYAERLWTEKAMTQKLEEYRNESAAIGESVRAEFDAIKADVKRAEDWSYTLNPTCLEPVAVQMLQSIDMTKDEYATLATRYAAENLTLYRVVLSEAARHGIELTDMVQIERDALNKALDTFLKYCESDIPTIDNPNPYGDNWGAIFAKVAQPLMTAGAEPLTIGYHG